MRIFNHALGLCALLSACSSTNMPAACKDGGAAVKRVFVTHAPFMGNLGGLAGADAKCQQAACGLGGTFRAWLSTTSTRAVDRIQEVGPWYLVDSTTKVFQDKNGMKATPLAALSLDETGGNVGLASVWTGTDLGGKGTGSDCAGWTSAGTTGGPDSFGTAGEADKTNNNWTNNGSTSCQTAASLYCIEQ